MTGRPADAQALRQVCCYDNGPRAAEFCCERPATVHIWIEGGFMTMSCADHVWWWKTHSHFDQHAIVDACGLPGTTWLYSWDNDPGRCVVDDVEQLDLHGVKALQAPVPA